MFIAYLKDMDDILPFWVGTWKGTVDNKEYTFEFMEFEHYLKTFPSGGYYYEDKLMIKFKVVDLANGATLYNDLNITNFEDYKIWLATYNQYNGYTFSFNDNELKCYNNVTFVLLKNPSNPNQVSYVSFEYEPLLDPSGCSYPSRQDIPMFLPKVDLILIRQ